MTSFLYKLSLGKYDSCEQLFAEPINQSNVSLMGQILTLHAIKTVIPYRGKCVQKLRLSFIKDLFHFQDPGYTLSEGYDCAQTAICFLWQFRGRLVSDIYGDNKYRKNITIRDACFAEVQRYLEKIFKYNKYFTRMTDNQDRHAPVVSFDFPEEQDYTAADKIVEAMHLTEGEKDTLNCYLGGMTYCETARFLSVNFTTVWRRRQSIQRKYLALSR